MWWAPHRSAVVYWVRRGALLNVVGLVPSAQGREESWLARGKASAWLESFAGATPRLAGIREQVEEAFITGYRFRDPLPRWSDSRLTILGDAAHPMHPFLAQGACQAIEDATMLAGCLSRHAPGAVAEALRDYERRRLPRATRVQTVAREHERMWHMADPAQIAVRNRQLRSLREFDPAAETIVGWLYRYDPVAAGRQPAGESGPRTLRPEARRAWTMLAEAAREGAGGIPALRAGVERLLVQASPPADAAEVKEVDAGGVPGLMVGPAGRPDAPLTVYLHGGGYCAGSARAAAGIAGRLSAATRWRCLALDYRLAPEAPFPAAVEDTVAAVRWWARTGTTPGPIAMVGDGAGGGLAVAAALALRDRGLRPPACVAALSPLADLTLRAASIDAADEEDPAGGRTLLVQMAAAYLQGTPAGTPLASPAHADLAGLPPLLALAAEGEALADDARALAARAERAGVRVQLTCTPTPFTPSRASTSCRRRRPHGPHGRLLPPPLRGAGADSRLRQRSHPAPRLRPPLRTSSTACSMCA